MKGSRLIAAILGILFILVLAAVSIIIKAKFADNLIHELLGNREGFNLEGFMTKRDYTLDAFKKIDFNEDGKVDIVATGISGNSKRQNWELFLIDGDTYEVLDSESGKVWDKGHRLLIKRINGSCHIIYDHSNEYGASKIYRVTQDGKLSQAAIEGNHYVLEKCSDSQVKISYENNRFSQIFSIAEGKSIFLKEHFAYLTRGVNYYFDEEKLVTEQFVSFPDIYETAGFSMETYYEWKDDKWQLSQVTYSIGPEFNIVEQENKEP